MVGIVNPYRYASAGLPVTSGLVLHLDAANRGTTTNRWDDLSGNGFHHTAPAATNFPNFSGDVAIFDGVNDYLLTAGANTFASAMSAGGECFLRLKNDADPSVSTAKSGLFIYDDFTGGSNHYPFTDSNIYLGWGCAARQSCGNPAQSLAAWHTLGIISIAGEWRLFINDTSQFNTGTNTPSFGKSTAARLGDGSSGATVMFDGQMRMVLFYDHKLSTADRTAVRDYLAGLI